jgi:hypothetical protein
MQTQNWQELFRKLPEHLHDALSLGLTTGPEAEVVVQRIFRIDTDVLILRGRMAGTQDSGRVIVLPYANISVLAFNRRLTEKELTEIFGAGHFSMGDKSTIGDTPQPAASAMHPADAAVAPAVPAPGANGAAMPSKSVLLAKLRARLSEHGGKKPSE